MKLIDLTIKEHDIEDDGYDASVYEREKKVSLLILRAFRKCGLNVIEHDSKHSGVRDKGDYWGYDVLYSEDDHEATVAVDEADIQDIAKLTDSGLIDGKCMVTPASAGYLRFTFKVHPNLHSGDASID